MANLAVTDLTFTVTKRLGRGGGTRAMSAVYGTILIPTSSDYAAGGVPISGVTNSATGAVVAGTALACPGLGCPNELVQLRVLANGNSAGLDDAFVVLFDSGAQADGTAPTVTHKLRIMKGGAPTITSVTAAAQTFTGSALAAHGHVLHLNDADQADGATTRVNAATNKLGCNTGSDVEVASVASSAGVGGIIQITAGTPAGTNGSSSVTGTLASALRFIEHANGALGEALTVYVYAVGW